MEASGNYEIVVGLEVHAQLMTRSKLFCGDSTTFGLEPNTQVSPVSLGHPGTLPVMNREAIRLAIRLGLACNCDIVQNNYFARKNYFYPDLPKGYQISQHTTPICKNGFLTIQADGESRKIRINRIHIEEDAGKSLHDEDEQFTRLDFNRAGMPLLEIVTEPDIRSAEQAYQFVADLRKLVRHLGVCDGNMEQGSLRCDVNISVRLKGDTTFGTRVEIKNLNSIRFIRKAIESESKRLMDLHSRGIAILQQTRGLDENDFSTYAIRTKEDEEDYRYFPEPDLPPFYIPEEMINKVRSEMPPLQESVKLQLEKDYLLPSNDAAQLAGDPELTKLFLGLTKETTSYKTAANWVLGPVRNHLAETDRTWDDTRIPTFTLATLIKKVEEGRISYGIAVQKVFAELIENPALDPESFIKNEGLETVSDAFEIESLVEAVLSKHSQKIVEYKKGKKGLISLFVGEVMKSSKGKADAQMVTRMILEKLNSY
jgi:aspartyl-tRNA(Asn)/glutamyl-tRNA(Gln) amidotransferase subunit B